MDAERNENMGRPKGFASIYDEGPRSARCETCGFCAVSEAVMTASGEGRKRYCCGWCENVAHRNESKRPVDVYLGTRSESGREVNAMRAALAQGRRI